MSNPTIRTLVEIRDLLASIGTGIAADRAQARRPVPNIYVPRTEFEARKWEITGALAAAGYRAAVYDDHVVTFQPV